MNHPVGFDVVAGRVTDVRPWSALFNSHLWYELLHMYLAGYMVVGFLLAGVYARSWLRGDRSRYTRTALVVGLTVAALAAPVQIVVGDWAGRTVARDQATKLAAFEGLGRTTAGAPLHLGGIYRDGEVHGGLEIPKLLSLLARHDPNATVRGLSSVPAADRPPVNVVRIAFQVMVSIGTFLAALSAWYLFARTRRRRVPSGRWFYRLLVLAGPASLVALISGWVTTEVGRQPWIVYEGMRTTEAVTAADGVPVGYATMAAFYACLIVAVAWILRRLAAVPMTASDAEPEPEHKPIEAT
jgi:cytochrome d ubiquinol oxidase subunit I